MRLKRRVLKLINSAIWNPLDLHLLKLSQAIQDDRDSKLSIDIDSDIYTLTDTDNPTILDVGANLGQSIDRFKQIWPSSRIISFEPNPSSVRQLFKKYSGTSGITIVESAVADLSSHRRLFQFEDSSLDSFFDRHDDSWITEDSTGSTEVSCVTLDDYCARNELESIDLLKVDVQGAELDVINGVTRLLDNCRIRLVQLELIFCDLYEGGVPAGSLLNKMDSLGYELVGFYQQVVHNGRLGWADGLWQVSPGRGGGRKVDISHNLLHRPELS